MQLKDYLSKKRGRQAALARAIGAHASDLCDWASGERPIPFKYGAPIERETGEEVTRQEMFPDNWKEIWPELADKKQAPRSTKKKAAK